MNEQLWEWIIAEGCKCKVACGDDVVNDAGVASYTPRKMTFTGLDSTGKIAQFQCPVCGQPDTKNIPRELWS